jgi:hypothetical protein
MTVGNTNLDTVNYDVRSYWASEWAGQFGGETMHAGSDVPGISSDHTTFGHIYKMASDGSLDFFSNLTFAPLGSTRYHHNLGDADSGGLFVDIWTNPL